MPCLMTTYKVTYLLQTFEETDLGITITPSMNFLSQVNESYTKAMQALLMIKRSFKFLTNKIINFCIMFLFTPTLITVYKSGALTYVEIFDKLEKYKEELPKCYLTCPIYPTLTD